MESNGYVKWPVFMWVLAGACTAYILLSGYVIANDAKRECDKDAMVLKLDAIQKDVSAIRVDIGPYCRQVDVVEEKNV
jgi:hypothetical protein